MNPLPNDWYWSTVAAEGAVDLGRQRHPDWHKGPNMRPYLRVANVFEDRIDLSDVKEMDFSGVFERYRLLPGDVLLNEGQTPELLGRPAIYRGIPAEVAFTNTLIRFRAGPRVLPEWALFVFRHYMHSGRFTREARITTNIAHLSAMRFKAVEFPVPPLNEQRRIVDILEDHLPRLAAAAQLLGDARVRRRALLIKHLDVLANEGDPQVSLGNLALSSGYGTSAKCVVGGPGSAVVRIPNLINGAIDLTNEKRAAAISLSFEGLMLSAGDILVVRTNGSRDLIGRTAVVQPGIEASFASYLIRYRVDRSRVLPEWVHWMLSRPAARATLEGMAASSAGQYNLSLGKLDKVVVPLPPMDEQASRLQHLRLKLDELGVLEDAMQSTARKEAALRRSLLAAAFSGRLIGRLSDLELTEESVPV